MVAKENIYQNAQGEIVELGDPNTVCFLLVPAGAEVPRDVEEKMEKKNGSKSAEKR